MVGGRTQAPSTHSVALSSRTFHPRHHSRSPSPCPPSSPLPILLRRSLSSNVASQGRLASPSAPVPVRLVSCSSSPISINRLLDYCLFPLYSHRLSLLLASSLVGNANDTAGSAAAGVASLERVGVAAEAEVVDTGVDDDRAADDRVGADEGDLRVCSTKRQRRFGRGERGDGRRGGRRDELGQRKGRRPSRAVASNGATHR